MADSAAGGQVTITLNRSDVELMLRAIQLFLMALSNPPPHRDHSTEDLGGVLARGVELRLVRSADPCLDQKGQSVRVR